MNWVLNDDVVVGLVATIAPNQPYSVIHGSVEEEMIQQFAQSHPFYKVDNSTVNSQLVVSTIGSQYASTIDPFKIANNCNGSINALKSQCTGAMHWE